MFRLTDEQKNLLIHIGKPDDGSQIHVMPDPTPIMNELIHLGLVYRRGKNHYDLTDQGEHLYGEITGDDVS